MAEDGKAMLHLVQSSKVYRVEARPLLFSQNANRLVHVTGYFGSVVEVEDPHVPSREWAIAIRVVSLPASSMMEYRLSRSVSLRASPSTLACNTLDSKSSPGSRSRSRRELLA